MMRNMLHSSLIPLPASSIVGPEVRIGFLGIFSFFRFFSFDITPGKIQFQLLKYHLNHRPLFCVTCPTGNPIYAGRASSYFFLPVSQIGKVP